jgi:hypothetical protein
MRRITTDGSHEWRRARKKIRGVETALRMRLKSFAPSAPFSKIALQNDPAVL